MSVILCDFKRSPPLVSSFETTHLDATGRPSWKTVGIQKEMCSKALLYFLPETNSFAPEKWHWESKMLPVFQGASFAESYTPTPLKTQRLELAPEKKASWKRNNHF